MTFRGKPLIIKKAVPTNARIKLNDIKDILNVPIEQVPILTDKCLDKMRLNWNKL